MKAYVFAEKGKLELRELPAPSMDEANPADRRAALLRPLCITPCASDVHTVFAGNGPRRENLVLGHEGIAEVLETGSEVKDFRPGEMVAVSAVMPDAEDGTGHEGGHFAGSKLGRNQDGMWAERFFVPEADQNLAHIPHGVTLQQALMAVDMMPTGFTAAEAAEIRPGQTAAVIGLGAVGLSAVTAAKQMGAGTVIAIGSSRSAQALSLAAEYGTDLVLSYRDGAVLYERAGLSFPWNDSDKERQNELALEKNQNRWKKQELSKNLTSGLENDLKSEARDEGKSRGRHPLANSTGSAAVDRVLDLTGENGVDRVLVCGGGPEALKQACDMVCYGTGIVSSVAYYEGNGDIALPIFSLGRGMAGKTFRFSFCRGGRHRLEKMLSLIAEKAIADPGRMVTHVLSGSSNIPRALEMMRDKPDGLIKVMVEL